MSARSQVRRYAVNVNQAVRALNAVGEAPDWLDQAVHASTAAVARLETVAQELADLLRRSPR